MADELRAHLDPNAYSGLAVGDIKIRIYNTDMTLAVAEISMVESSVSAVYLADVPMSLDCGEYPLRVYDTRGASDVLLTGGTLVWDGDIEASRPPLADGSGIDT